MGIDEYQETWDDYYQERQPENMLQLAEYPQYNTETELSQYKSVINEMALKQLFID